jgi:hypothetical protein
VRQSQAVHAGSGTLPEPFDLARLRERFARLEAGSHDAGGMTRPPGARPLPLSNNFFAVHTCAMEQNG